MRIIQKHSHRLGLEMLAEKGMENEVFGILDEPEIEVVSGAAGQIRKRIGTNLSRLGWALNPRVHPKFGLTINAVKGRIGLTVQTGNIARGIYDLMKFQAMHINGRIDIAVLILPTSSAAGELGSNVANFKRIASEMELFHDIITVPCLVLGIDTGVPER